MKKNKVIASAMLGICLSASLLAGATYALFTSEHEVNIAVKSGKVDVLATIDQTSVQTKSLTTDWEDGTDHLYNGTATFNEDSSSLDLSNIVPGDAIKFNINVKNNSTVAVKYMTTIAKLEDDGLFKGLEITADGETFNGKTVYTGWKELQPTDTELKPLTFVISMPKDAGNEYQDKSCKLSYKVEAIQGNATTPETVIEASDNEDLANNIKNIFGTGEETKDSAEIHLPEGNFSIKNITGAQLSGKTIEFVGNGEDTVYGSTYTDGKVGEYGADYSLQGADVTFRNMTINLGEADYNGFVRAENLVFENCVINGRGSYWGQDGVTTFKNCTFNDVNGGYNIYTYSAQDYVFDGCTFNSSKGKFFNVYKESENTFNNIEIKNCTFNGSNGETDKAVLCIKLFRGNNWNIVWSNNTINNVLELTESSEFNTGVATSYTYGVGYYKNIFGVRADGKTSFTEEDASLYATTTITVDGVTRFENCEVK